MPVGLTAPRRTRRSSPAWPRVAAVTVEQEVAVVTAGDDIGAGVAVDLVAAGLALQAVVGRPAEDAGRHRCRP